MSQPIPRFIAPTVLVLAVLAVAFAGLGGMVIGDKIYPLFGAGVLFCLCMILVFNIVLGGLVSTRAMYGLTASQGALMGACGGLFLLPGSGLLALIGLTALGAAVGVISQWAHEFRRSIVFGD
ncbi:MULTISPECIES: hypothetical protein [unclassified Brevundimonas]|uniref:hypothetical protein n=1 Tax=unclassified Brevundimonas TaxID=2622653 RepID=UPI0025C57EB9|nr:MULTISPECIES: hypothetical protein [unclassified Brevundimonas]